MHQPPLDPFLSLLMPPYKPKNAQGWAEGVGFTPPSAPEIPSTRLLELPAVRVSSQELFLLFGGNAKSKP